MLTNSGRGSTLAGALIGTNMIRYTRTHKDDNHSSIVGNLRKMGYSVLELAAVGGGCPDILVGHHGRNYLFEIKGAKGKLLPDQERFTQAWRGQVNVVRSVEEALLILTK